ncbi:hypothetical protein L195_g043220, partial [Trifolium pratense]
RECNTAPKLSLTRAHLWWQELLGARERVLSRVVTSRLYFSVLAWVFCVCLSIAASLICYAIKVPNASSAPCQTNYLNPDTNEDDGTDEHEQEEDYLRFV